MKIKIFISYSHKDEDYLNEIMLIDSLKGIEKQYKEVILWWDKDISTAQYWDRVIKRKIDESHIAIVIVSQWFLDSDYCQNVEISKFLQNSKEKGLIIFPIIISKCEWEEHKWLTSLQHIPCGNKTIRGNYTQQKDRDELFYQIRKDLKKQITVIKQDWKDSSQPYSQISIAGKPPQPGVESYFLDRESEQKKISEFLATDTKLIVCVIGRGGIGKTALVSKVLTDLGKNKWPQTDKKIPINGISYLTSTAKMKITLDKLFCTCAEMIGGDEKEKLNRILRTPGRTTEEKVERLIEILSDGHYIILIDNIEDLLDENGKINDEELNIFFKKYSLLQHNSHLLITSRIKLKFPFLLRFERDVQLKKGLPTREGVKFLRDFDPNGYYGLQDAPEEQIENIVKLLGGVPLALRLVAQKLMLISDEKGKATLNDIDQNLFEKGNIIQNLLEDVYKSLNEDEICVMKALSVFGRPVPMEAVGYLLEPIKPVLNITPIACDLINQNFINIDRTNNTISLLPIEIDYSYSLIPKEGDCGIKIMERRAAQYYLEHCAPEEEWINIDCLEPKILEFEHLVKAKDYNEAATAMNKIDSHYLAKWGYYEQVKKMRTELQNKITNKNLKAINLNRLGEASIELGKRDEAIRYLENSCKLAVETKNALLEASGLTLIGITRFHLAEFDNSIVALDKAKNIFEHEIKTVGISKDNEKTYGICLNWLGTNYRNKEDYDKALEHHNKALHIARKVKSGRLEAHVIANIGAVALWNKKFDNVIDYWKESLKISEDIDDKPWIAHYTIDVGYMYFLMREYDEAMKYLVDGTIIAMEFCYEENISRGLMNQGNVWFAHEEFEKASVLYEEALEKATTRKILKLTWRIEHNIGNIFRKQGDLDNACKKYSSAIELLKNMMSEYKECDRAGYLEHRLDPFRSMILLLLEKKEEEKALEYAKTFGYELLMDYLDNRKKGKNLNIEEKEDLNFFNGYYIPTE